jgi:hypothetical protein
VLIGDPYEQEDMIPMLPAGGLAPRPFGTKTPLGPSRRKMVGAGINHPQDQGAMGEGWRNILLDQLRTRGANFFGV